MDASTMNAVSMHALTGIFCIVIYGAVIIASWCFTRSAIVSALKKFFDEKNKEK